VGLLTPHIIEATQDSYNAPLLSNKDDLFLSLLVNMVRTTTKKKCSELTNLTDVNAFNLEPSY
jgi:hypothetical protein